MTGVVLAGGRSSRFGTDKLVVPEHGVPLLRRAVSAVADVCGDVVVVLPPTGPEPPVLGGLPVRFARDEVEGEGPLAGLCAGFERVDTALTLVAAGDMPVLVDAVLRLMVQRAEEGKAPAVALLEETTWRPAPCVLRTEPALREARALLAGGERSLRSLLTRLAVVAVEEPAWRALDPAGDTLRDVDRREDLAAD